MQIREKHSRQSLTYRLNKVVICQRQRKRKPSKYVLSMNDSRSHHANDGANITIIFLLRKYFAAKFTKNIPEFDTIIGLPSDKFLNADAAILI